ncbi:MAG: pyridoxamine 5'-phosphate oxidase [Deltaproteobacteria bacterium]|nr:pyridoxamine 5'-phosphate oxidase [Deltaproteobacteria bacterium]
MDALELVDFCSEVLPEARTDPMRLIDRWIGEASRTGLPNPNSMVLATVGADGAPDARLVLLKAVEGRSLVFFTNLESKKALDLAVNPSAALVFHFASLERQIRVKGRVDPVNRLDVDSYFRTRPRGSQLGAWASAQSRPLRSRQELADRIAELEVQYAGREVPAPSHWGGYRLIVSDLEAWVGRADRLHDRFLFRLDAGDAIRAQRLSP